MSVYERAGHEVLVVDRVETGTQAATVRRHHTLYAHLRVAAASTVTVGDDLAVNITLVTWDAGELVTDMDRPVLIFVDGVQVDEVFLVAGAAQAVLQFADPGAYTLEVQGDLLLPDGLEVAVS